MAQSIREVMTSDPHTVSTDATLQDAAREMKSDDIGAVLVEDKGSVAGILTDRDIVVRAIAEGRDPSSTKVGDVASRDVTTLTPDSSVEDAIRIVRERRLELVLVDEEEISDAMRFLYERAKLACEPAGAVAVAALRAGKVPLAGEETVVAVVSGGNVSAQTAAAILARP